MDYRSARLVTDVAGLNQLKTEARANQAATAGEVAKQFEGMLVQMMIKSMRQASLGEGILDSQQSLFYRDLYDQQLALHLAERGLGLAEVIKRQMLGQATREGDPAEATTPQGRDLADYRARPVRGPMPTLSEDDRPGQEQLAEAAPPPEREARARRNTVPLDSAEGFVAELWPAAQRAAADLGLPPEALLAQAALESGWGRAVIRDPEGNNSHNLFGIKAHRGWDGERVNVATLEYEGGTAVRRRDDFRAYPSYAASFQDYVAFLRDNPRYRDALEAKDPAAYFTALQRAGYATDPAYARKVLAILDGPRLRAALEQVQTEGAATGNGAG